MSGHEKDVPGVIVFPPLIPLTVLVVGVAARLVLSAGGDLARAVRGRASSSASSLFALGVAMLDHAAERAFKRVGTNVNPFRPSLAIARDGIYGRVRNPMYVGMGLALLGDRPRLRARMDLRALRR